MLNPKVLTAPSLRLVLAITFVLGLYGPLPALVTPGALADTAIPVTAAAEVGANLVTAAAGATAPPVIAAAADVSGPSGSQAPADSATPPTPVAPSADPQKQLKTIFENISNLVKKFYPKASVTISDSKMHVEDKCKKEEGFYSERTVLAPQSGGILFDITLKTGAYKGDDKDRLPSEVQDGYHTNLTMAPYSRHQDKHLLAHMSFPSDMDPKFEERFKKLVDDFNAQELAAEAAAAKAAAEAAASKAAADKAAAETVAAQASKDAAASKAAAFGADNMSVHQFGLGKFGVLFSDGYQTNHSAQMGLAKVDYSCQAGPGSFNVSYVVLPRVMAVSEANGLFEKITASMLQELNGVSTQQVFTTERGCPGRQITASIKGKPDTGALVRLYLAGDKVYELSAVGKKAWLDSPAVNSFIDSFEFGGEWGRYYQQQQDLPQ